MSLMTYRLEMSQTAMALSELLLQGGRVQSDDLPMALRGHASVLDLVQQVHHDLVSGHSASPDLARLGAHPLTPVAQMLHRLQAHPRLRAEPERELLGTPRETLPGSLWQVVASSSEVAHSHWQGFAERSFPGGPVTWSEVADVAAVAEATVLLNGDLADSLAAAGRAREAGIFRRAASEGLSDAAHAVTVLAATGPVNPLSLSPAGVAEPLPIRRAADLPDAIRKFTALLNQAESLTPTQTEFMLRVVAEATLLAASSLDRDAVSLARTLRGHGDRLARTMGSIRRVATIHPGDRDAVQQISLVHLWLERRVQRHALLTAHDARRLAEVIPSTTVQVVSIASELAGGPEWLFEVDGRWSPQPNSDNARRLEDRLKGLTSSAAEVDLELRKLPQRQELVATPRVVLADALSMGRVLSRQAAPSPRRLPWRRR